jgi:hypothetical protein
MPTLAFATVHAMTTGPVLDRDHSRGIAVDCANVGTGNDATAPLVDHYKWRGKLHR